MKIVIDFKYIIQILILLILLYSVTKLKKIVSNMFFWSLKFNFVSH